MRSAGAPGKLLRFHLYWSKYNTSQPTLFVKVQPSVVQKINKIQGRTPLLMKSWLKSLFMIIWPGFLDWQETINTYKCMYDFWDSTYSPMTNPCQLRLSLPNGPASLPKWSAEFVRKDLSFQMFNIFVASWGLRFWLIYQAIPSQHETFVGRKADLLWKLSRAGQSKTNACRNLHKLIDSNNILYPVHIDCGLIHVVFRKPEYRSEKVWWPFLRMQAWVEAILQESPRMLLAGHDIANPAGWRQTFSTFWESYRHCNPQHCIYTDGLDTRFCIPYFLHGDEGRGYCRRPFMVESFQPIISHKGLGVTNESGQLGHDLQKPYFTQWVPKMFQHWRLPHKLVLRVRTAQVRHTLTTRFLLTAISSWFFDGEKTLDDLHRYIAEDATTLYRDGITVPPLVGHMFDNLFCFGAVPLSWYAIKEFQKPNQSINYEGVYWPRTAFTGCGYHGTISLPRLAPSRYDWCAAERKETGHSWGKILATLVYQTWSGLPVWAPISK